LIASHSANRTIGVAERLRLERGAEHLHVLGPRCVAEFLADTLRTNDRMLPMLDDWLSLPTVEMVSAAALTGFCRISRPLTDEAASIDLS